MAEDQEIWVPLRKAVTAVADAYHAELKGDYSESRREAISALCRRLGTSFIKSRAILYALTEDSEENQQHTSPTKIDPAFWVLLRDANNISVLHEDWVSGEFAFHISATETSPGLFGMATGVEVTTDYWPVVGLTPHSPAWMKGQKIAGAGRYAEFMKQFGARRPLPQTMLEQWWKDLSSEARAVGQEDLLDLCRSAFPRHDITRDRIRKLTGPRKRGPKPFSGKPSA